MSSDLLSLLGLAKKAGRLEVGEEPTGAAARARQARLILVAADAADNSQRRASHFAEAGAVPWAVLPCTKAELGGILGRRSCAMAALTDAGFAAALTKKLAALDPERYGETAAALDGKAQKVLQRQKEQRRHEKNLREGRRKPWASPVKAAPKPAGDGAPAKAPASAKPQRRPGGAPPRTAPKGKLQVKGKLPPRPKKPT